MGRRLGQHFLSSASALRRIAEAACPQPDEPLAIEIGPGRGELTRYLVPRAGRVIAIELDDNLIDLLRSRFRSVEIIHADALETPLTQWGPAVVTGNLPYYVATPIIEKILAMRGFCRRAVLMVQKEVAERLVAKPGSRQYGYLSVATQAQALTEMLFPVPRGAFRPPPKVDSAVIRLTPFDAPPLPGFLEFVSMCFQMKRKTLRNNLVAAYPQIGLMPQSGIRAEQLSLDELRTLYQVLASAG